MSKFHSVPIHILAYNKHTNVFRTSLSDLKKIGIVDIQEEDILMVNGKVNSVPFLFSSLNVNYLFFRPTAPAFTEFLIIIDRIVE
jgi:hypothetical protein